MQISRWLIGKQKFGLGDDGAGYANQLLLPAGKLARIQVLFADDLKTIERVAHQRGAFTLTIMPVGERNIEVLVNGQIVEQMILLEDEADLFVSKVARSFALR